MRMKKAVLALLAGGLLLPVAGSAGRLNGSFATEQKDQAANTNDACIVTDDTTFSANGVVTGVAAGCTAVIDYNTPQPDKASSTALKGNKTTGNSKVSQSIFTDVDITITDSDGIGGVACAAAGPLQTVVLTNASDTEKCKVTASMKGTEAGATDTVQSSNVSSSCELGEAGANLVTSIDGVPQVPPTPSATQITAVVAAFDGRKDVKIANNGKLSIKHKGVPNTGADPCD